MSFEFACYFLGEDTFFFVAEVKRDELIAHLPKSDLPGAQG